MSKPPVREIPDRDGLSPKWRGLLSFAQATLPALSAIAVGLYTVIQYFDGQQKYRDQQADLNNKYHDQQVEINKTRLLEAQKAFFDNQLKLYMEAAKIAGQLVAIDRTKDGWPEGKEWKEAYERFYQLFWTELSVVEDNTVKTAMENFSSQLQKVMASPNDRSGDEEFQQLSYRLARQIRSSIEASWRVQLGTVSETKDAVRPP
jgi:hypothetical protein